MGGAEDEVLIRDDSGLLLGSGESKLQKSQQWTRKMIRTFSLSLGFLVLGLCVAVPGPTLLDLEDKIKASMSEMMVVFASRSLGYLLGALLGGVLFDCFDRQLLLFSTFLVSSVATIVIPWSLSLVVMATMFALQGITMGVLDTGGNVFCIRLWGKKNAPFIQTLHFAFGIGAFVAPLLAKPFLSASTEVSNSTSIIQGNIPVATFPHGHRSVWFNSSENYGFSDTVSDSGVQIRDIISKENNVLKEKRDVVSIVNKIGSMNQNLDDLVKRSRRQAGGEDGDKDGLWKWKKHQSRRDASGSASSASGVSSEIIAPKNSTDTAQTVNHVDIPETNMSKITSNLNENTKLSNTSLVPDDKSALETNHFSDNTGVTNNNVSTLNASSAGSSNLSLVVSTIATTAASTTVEEKVQKPSAATDNNRKPSSADGKPIKEHIETHQAIVDHPVNNAGTTSKPQEERNSSNEETTNGTLSNSADSSDIGNTQGAGNVTAAGNVTFVLNLTDSVNASLAAVSNASDVVSTKSPNATAGPDTADRSPTAKQASPDSVVKVTDNTTAGQLTTQVNTTAKPTTTASTTTSTTQSTTTRTTTTTTSSTTSTTASTTTLKVSTTTTTSPKITTAKSTTNSKVPEGNQQTAKKPNSETTKPGQSSKGTGINGLTSLGSPLFSNLTTTKQPGPANSTQVVVTTDVVTKPGSSFGDIIDKAKKVVQSISRIQVTYGIIGLVLFLIAILFLVLYCKDRGRYVSETEIEELEKFQTSVTCAKATLIILLGLFFFLYMGLEVTYGALVPTFAVEYNGWPKEQGAVVAAIFWGSLAAGRGLSIFIAHCCGPNVMLTVDSVFMIVGGLVLSIGIHFFDKLLWLGTLILGLGMSSVFPAGISWAEKYFHLTGKSMAIFVLGSAIGQMIVPIITGYSYEKYGAMTLMYITVALSVGTSFIYFGMQCIAVRRGSTLRAMASNGFLPLQDEEVDDTVEMDDYVHFDKSQARRRHDRRGGGDAEYHTLISDLDDD